MSKKEEVSIQQINDFQWINKARTNLREKGNEIPKWLETMWTSMQQHDLSVDEFIKGAHIAEPYGQSLVTGNRNPSRQILGQISIFLNFDFREMKDFIESGGYSVEYFDMKKETENILQRSDFPPIPITPINK